jgi:hypothetical protein
MIGRPARHCGVNSFKPYLAQVKMIDEDIYDPYVIVLGDILVKKFRKPGALGLHSP